MDKFVRIKRSNVRELTIPAARNLERSMKVQRGIAPWKKIT